VQQVDDELFDRLASAAGTLGLELVDVEVRSGLVRIVVDRPGGADVDAIADASRVMSRVLDEHDPQPGRRYTLEVSSPGIERRLRLPRHYVRAIGETVTVRTATGAEGERRVKGTLAAADDEGFLLEGEGLPPGGRRFTYTEVERVRTVFDWPSSSRGPSAGRPQGSSPGSRPSPRGASGKGPKSRGPAARAATDSERVTVR
jgi:ribosome maturation factor RimP